MVLEVEKIVVNVAELLCYTYVVELQISRNENKDNSVFFDTRKCDTERSAQLSHSTSVNFGTKVIFTLTLVAWFMEPHRRGIFQLSVLCV
jgi:hypothetical protein